MANIWPEYLDLYYKWIGKAFAQDLDQYMGRQATPIWALRAIHAAMWHYRCLHLIIHIFHVLGSIVGTIRNV